MLSDVQKLTFANLWRTIFPKKECPEDIDNMSESDHLGYMKTVFFSCLQPVICILESCLQTLSPGYSISNRFGYLIAIPQRKTSLLNLEIFHSSFSTSITNTRRFCILSNNLKRTALRRISSFLMPTAERLARVSLERGILHSSICHV